MKKTFWKIIGTNVQLGSSFEIDEIFATKESAVEFVRYLEAKDSDWDFEYDYVVEEAK